MGLHGRRIDLDLFQLGITQGLGQPFPDSGGTPAVEPLPDRVGLPESGREVLPGNSGLEDVEHCVDEQPVVDGCSPGVCLLSREQVSDQLPLGIGQFMATSHRLSSLSDVILKKSESLRQTECPGCLAAR